MPIGFWAVSRSDLQQLIAYKADGCTPTNWYLEMAAQELGGKLEVCLEELAERYAQGIKQETAQLQATI